MVSEVNGSHNPAVVSADPRATAVDRPRPAQASSNSTAAAAVAPPSTDKVFLTQEAEQLQALDKAVTQVPEVDRQRVDQVRQALADGSYQFDSRKTADKLMQIESLLPPAATAKQV